MEEEGDKEKKKKKVGRRLVMSGEGRKDGSVAVQTQALQSNSTLLPPPLPSFLAAGFSYDVFSSLNAQLAYGLSDVHRNPSLISVSLR